jgi:hypothetical protein
VVTKNNGTVSSTGLFYLDTTAPTHNKEQDGFTMVATVDEIKSKYTDDDYRRAVVAREVMIKLGRPSVQDFIRIVQHMLLPNCPVTVRDIRAAEHTFGSDIGSLRRKTTRSRPHKVDINVSSLPIDVMTRYRQVTVSR